MSHEHERFVNVLFAFAPHNFQAIFRPRRQLQDPFAKTAIVILLLPFPQILLANTIAFCPGTLRAATMVRIIYYKDSLNK